MRILLVSPLGRNDESLSTFIGPLQALGHSVVDDAAAADVAFLSLRWGQKGYGIDLTAAILKRLPFATFDFMDYVIAGRSEWLEWGATPNFRGLDSHPTYWNMPWKLALQAVEAAGLLRVYFMRYMQRGHAYPAWVRPIEQAMYAGSDFPLASGVGTREVDLCFVGTTSQYRSTLVCHLIESGLFKIDWEWPLRRMEWPAWVARHARAKMFLEINGGGQGSDRPCELIRAAPMVKQRSSRRWVYDWTDGVNCLEIADDRGVPQPGDLANLLNLLNDPVRLQAMYEAGAAFAQEKFSRHARTEYVLGVLKEFGIT